MDLCKITCGGEIHLDCLMFNERNSVFDLWIYKSEKTSSVGTTNFAHKFIILLPDDGEKQTNKLFKASLKNFIRRRSKGLQRNESMQTLSRIQKHVLCMKSCVDILQAGLWEVS